jgi:hypothetical protein
MTSRVFSFLAFLAEPPSVEKIFAKKKKKNEAGISRVEEKGA